MSEQPDSERWLSVARNDLTVPCSSGGGQGECVSGGICNRHQTVATALAKAAQEGYLKGAERAAIEATEMIERKSADGYRRGVETAAKACEALHCPGDEIYKPYGRCAPECMALDYAEKCRALAPPEVKR